MQAFMQSLQMRCPVAAHRVVDSDDGERAEAVAARRDQVHLGDLLVERAAGEGHAKDALLEARRSFSLRPCEQLSLPWLWHQMQ
jgi:hypothetical protein